MLKIQDISKSYAGGKVKAVDNVSLHVQRGEIFGFIGPNGAGKTTTIKMICGILPSGSGKILVNGYDITENPIAAKRAIGYVPDNHEVYERLSGLEYLNFIADVYEVDPAVRNERIKKYLEMFSIADAAGEKIKSYSHGMKQKLMVTAALLHQPPLWLLDEPLTGLDPKASMLLKEEMHAHCDAGYTVFFSTHVLEVAERLCDRIGIIQHGKLIAVGTLDELRGPKANETLEKIFFELTESEE